MAGLRELVLKLSANTVSFRQDIGAAVKQVDLFASHVTRSMKSANGALVGFAAGAVSIYALKSSFDAVVDSLANLDDMAQKTGSSVENLGRLSKVAKVFGVEMESVDKALTELARGMTGVNEESSKTRTALEALGVSTDGLETRDTSEVFIEIAKALQQYQDGAGKAALVTDLFKKSGVDLLPFLNDVADNVDRFTGASSQAARDAAKFQDSLGMLTMRSGELQKSIARQVLPAVSDFTAALADVIESGEALSASPAIADWAEAAVSAASYVIDAFDGLQRTIKFVSKGIAVGIALITAANARERQAILDAFAEDEQKLLLSQLTGSSVRDRMAESRKQRENAVANPNAGNAGKGMLRYSSSSSDADKKLADQQKQIREAAIKALEDQANTEKEILASRNRLLDLYNNENLLSFRDYFSARKSAQEEFIRNTSALYDQEISALRKAQRASTDQGGRAELEVRINELLQKKVELQRQGSEDAAGAGGSPGVAWETLLQARWVDG